MQRRQHQVYDGEDGPRGGSKKPVQDDAAPAKPAGAEQADAAELPAQAIMPPPAASNASL
jgi:hypothetical protein